MPRSGSWCPQLNLATLPFKLGLIPTLCDSGESHHFETPMPDNLSHFDEQGASRMVDVGDKAVTHRVAIASAIVRMKPETLALIRNKAAAKGDVLEVARLAAIMAAKRTDELIPLCHSLPLERVDVRYTFFEPDGVAIEVEVATTAKTGVEMEALVAASVCALTIYDMCKAVDRGMVIERVQLEAKSGGRSGDFRRDAK